MTKQMKFGIGQAIKRVEDVRFITGRGNYTADSVPANALHAAFLRSPYAHARFTIGDLSAAGAMPGVRAIYTLADLLDLGELRCIWTINNADGSLTPTKPYPIMADGEVFHVGDIVAMVVAETEFAARDAVEAIEVTWEPLEVVVGLDEALAADAPQLFHGAPGNVAYDTHFGDAAATDAVFARAAHLVRLRVVNNRVIANYIETRGACGEYDPATGLFTLHVTSQGVHGFRDQIADNVLRVPRDAIRVVTHDVGGGFGTKAMLYREYPLVLEAARRCGRPVRWIAERSEHFTGDAQARDNLTTAEMALDADGRFLGLRLDILGNLGAYPSQFGPAVAYVGGSMATGAYDIGAIFVRVRGVYTHTVPTDAYRGAGNPEATYVLERLVDRCARALGLSPEAIRARNFVSPAQMPYRTGTGRTYDVGDFAGTMRAALELAGRDGFEDRAALSKVRGKLRGFGLASYIECTAWGDGEKGSVQLDPDGDFTLLVGTQSSGQGHQTAYAQVAAHYLDVEPQRVRVIQGDTTRVQTGAGTGGSRSIPVGAVMVSRVSEKLVASLKQLAADALEASAGDLEVSDGGIRVVGTDRFLPYAEIAALAIDAPDRLIAIDSFTPPDATYPNGTHCCEVEVDPETGAVSIARYSVVDDFGLTLNPLLLEGQIHGGIVQGIGQALHEAAVYSPEGQLLSASLMDYCLPRADQVPNFHIGTRNVPSTTNPLGLKGAGEAGSVGACPAVLNAVSDALWRAYGPHELDMPATPLAIFNAMETARRNRPS
ncbi:MAG: xanthine dehydrogenase family protein molybdopterin-binding subunit [Rhizobiaceae bacterium]|nr:xanthine dehydrogenase family protein molybdopterin-binding subunit [Rhizobiaceae bacterium]